MRGYHEKLTWMAVYMLAAAVAVILGWLVSL
jgi:hypothetical protein